MVPSLINIKFKFHVVAAVDLQGTDRKYDIRIFPASAQQDFFDFVSLLFQFWKAVVSKFFF